MQIVDRIIFDSTAAADGAWQDISLMPSWSLQIVGIDQTVWVEASNDPNVNTDGATIAAPAAPGVLAVSATTFNTNVGTFTAKATYLTAQGGETIASGASSSQAVGAGQTLEVTSPAQDAGGFAVGWNVYVNNGNGIYIKQNSAPLKIGQAFVLYQFVPNVSLIPPSSNTAKIPNVGVSICGNLGALTFTAAPVGSTTGSFGETQIVADAGNGNQCMISTSCLVFKWLRVRKSGAGAKETIAYLMGQNG